MQYEYKVVPFIGRAKLKDKHGAQKVATQLQNVIDQYTAQGWEFYRVDRVQITEDPGFAAAALTGAKVATGGFDVMVFRKSKL